MVSNVQGHKVTDEFRRSLPPHTHVEEEASAQHMPLRRGEARMQPGLAVIEGTEFQARSAVWFIADDGARVVVVSNEKDLAGNLLRGERPDEAARLFMKVGGSFLERLRGRVTGRWHGNLGLYQWQQTPAEGASFSQLPQAGQVYTDDALQDGGAVRGYFTGSSAKCSGEGQVDVHFVGAFCASPINLSSAHRLRQAIAAMARACPSW